jgi:cytochrome oxidase assembly protein ShyY1
MVPLSYFAAQWQLDRHQQRDAENLLLQSALSVEPQPIANFYDVEPDEFTRVLIDGDFSGSEILWRKQVQNGIPGFIVLQNVTLQNGKSLTLALGWTDDATFELGDDAELPLTGFVRFPNSSGTSPSDVPPGQSNYITEMMRSTNFNFYIQSQTPPKNLSKITLPEITSGPHLGYVGQWILIGIASIVIYVIALRRIRTDYAREIKS